MCHNQSAFKASVQYFNQQMWSAPMVSFTTSSVSKITKIITHYPTLSAYTTNALNLLKSLRHQPIRHMYLCLSDPQVSV
jgi:hypothetical protein